MAEFPAIPLFTDAYLADTRHLTTEEHGAYLLLIMEAWRRPMCSLPDDDDLLARLAGLTPERWGEVKKVVMAFWTRDGRRKTWTQKRLVKERDFVTKKSASQADKAAKRWSKKKNEDAAALPMQCPEDAPTPTPTLEKTEPNGSVQKKASRRSRLPDGWSLPDDWAAYAQAKGHDPATIAAEAERFANHHRSHGSLMADWQAAWRTWVGNIGRFAPPRKAPAASPTIGDTRIIDGIEKTYVPHTGWVAVHA